MKSEIRALRSIVSEGKWWIIGLSMAVGAVAVAWKLATGDRYRARVVVSVVSKQTSGDGLGSLISQLGPIGSLVGTAGIGGTNQSESLAVLQSRALTQRFIEEYGLIPILFPAREDGAAASWIDRLLGGAPTPWQAVERFDKKRRVVRDADSGLVTLEVTWTDAVQAARWANDLVRLTNKVLREEELEESQKNIAYLSDQAAKTSLVEVRQALSSLIESEIKREMIANGTDEFAFKVIDPAVPPERPLGPGLLLSGLLGAVAGVCVSTFSLFLRATLKE